MAFDSLDALDWLRKQLEQDDADLLREMVKSLAEQLMSADADAIYAGPATASAAPSGSTHATATAIATLTPGPAPRPGRA